MQLEAKQNWHGSIKFYQSILCSCVKRQGTGGWLGYEPSDQSSNTGLIHSQIAREKQRDLH